MEKEVQQKLKQVLVDNDDVPMSSFTNEYGEEFRVYNAGITIYIQGDETDWDIINLFTGNFSIWSKDELSKLGKAIAETSI